MCRPGHVRVFLLATVAALIFSSVAEAKRFKRYPDDLKELEQAKAAPAPRDVEEGGEYAAAEPEEAPGLFGYAMHGCGGVTVEYIYTGDVFSIYQFTAEWGLLDGRLSGDFHIGMWYHNGQFEDPGNAAVTYVGNHGVHMCFDQLICKESWDRDDDQGLGVFFQYGWAPEDRNEVPDYFGAGLVYKGLIPGRDDDITGLGVANAFFSNRMGVGDKESTIELFHKIPLTPYITLQPDLQYIAGPSGTERDAAVVGLRFEAVL